MGRQRKKVKNVRARDEEERDRISKLPDDLIHQILSLIDAKDALQTSLLSTKWRHLWKSLPNVNFNIIYFTQIEVFSKFVAQFLLHRDNNSDLCVLNLNCSGAIQRSLVNRIVNRIAVYGASHNLQHLHLSVEACQLPPSVFTIQTLKQFSLTSLSLYDTSFIMKSSLILPALTTLVFDQVLFELDNNEATNKPFDLFSKLSNLKNLSLFDIKTKGFKVFHIISPQLENLHIQFIYKFPCEFVISAPKLSSFKYNGNTPLPISARDLHCLDNAYLDIRILDCECEESVFAEIFGMFHQLRDAKFVTLTLSTIWAITLIFGLLKSQPSPFHKMERLKIKDAEHWSPFSLYSNRLLTYLCNSSPSSVVINEMEELFKDHDAIEDIYK